MPPGRLGVAVQADADADAQALERLKHGPAEQCAIGLHGHIDFRWHLGTEHADEIGQPLRPGEQGLAAVQDYFDARQAMCRGVLRDAPDGQ